MTFEILSFKQSVCASFLLLMLASCGSTNHVVSNQLFQKRKHTKGWFIGRNGFSKSSESISSSENSLKQTDLKNDVYDKTKTVVVQPEVQSAEEMLFTQEKTGSKSSVFRAKLSALKSCSTVESQTNPVLVAQKMAPLELTNRPRKSDIPTWKFFRSLFFSFTSLTTIIAFSLGFAANSVGYGVIAFYVSFFLALLLSIILGGATLDAFLNRDKTDTKEATTNENMVLATMTLIPIAVMCAFIGFLFQASSIAPFFFAISGLAILPVLAFGVIALVRLIQKSR